MSPKPKTRADIEAILARVRYLDRTFHLLPKGDGWLVRLSYVEADVETGAEELQQSRKWYVSPWSTETEIVETAFACAERSALHVLKEHFTYEGHRIYSPHFSVRARIALCERGEFDRREDARTPKERRPGPAKVERQSAARRLL